MIITVKMIMEKNPCEDWTEKKISKIIGNGKTLIEILSMSKIKAADRIWCVTQFLSDKVNREFAIWCVRQCKTDVKEITEYIDVIEKYYSDWASFWVAANRSAYRVDRRKQIKKLKELIIKGKC